MLTMLPGLFFADHQLGGILHQEEGRAHVDRHHPVEELGRGVEDGAAIGEAGGIDQNVDAAEGLVGRRDHGPAVLHRGEVGGDEVHRHAGVAGDRGGDRIALFAVAPARDDAGGPRLREDAGDRRAEPLRAAGNDRDLSVETIHGFGFLPGFRVTLGGKHRGFNGAYAFSP